MRSACAIYQLLMAAKWGEIIMDDAQFGENIKA